jgi:hypothetical protein
VVFGFLDAAYFHDVSLAKRGLQSDVTAVCPRSHYMTIVIIGVGGFYVRHFRLRRA